MERSEEKTLRDSSEAFHRGTDTYAYLYWGVHREETVGKCRYVFRVFAPHARAVWLCGDFLANGVLTMWRTDSAGTWETVIEAVASLEGMRYAFRLDTCAGVKEIADLYTRRGMGSRGIGSLICTESAYLWGDSLWMWHRARICRKKRERGYAYPLNCYRVHLGSFLTLRGRSNAVGDACLNYRELGMRLARYLSDMGYTHVRLMPLTEHGQDSSHGYCSWGYFAPTARFGTPDDLREMIDTLHRAGIGVVMELPLGICSDGAGKVQVMEPACPELRSRLLSAALFWTREFHMDGLCLMGMQVWSDTDETTRLAATELLMTLCAAVRREAPDVLLIAGEELGGSVRAGEIGFDLLCHNRFAGDVTHYLGTAPTRRRYLRDRLMLSVRDAVGDGEHYLLPLSHEAIGGGREALLRMMYGGYLQKFEGMRLCLAYQMVHPGKKELFMGCELGQLRPWDDTLPRDWFLLDLDLHGRLHRYVRALNHFYREDGRLWQMDDAWNGVSPAEIGSGDGEVFAIKRYDAAGRELLAVFQVSEETVVCRCAVGGRYVRYREVFNSDRAAFGGQERVGAGQEVAVDADGGLLLTLPPMTAVFYEPVCGKEQPGRVVRNM